MTLVGGHGNPMTCKYTIWTPDHQNHPPADTSLMSRRKVVFFAALQTYLRQSTAHKRRLINGHIHKLSTAYNQIGQLFTDLLSIFLKRPLCENEHDLDLFSLVQN